MRAIQDEETNRASARRGDDKDGRESTVRYLGRSGSAGARSEPALPVPDTEADLAWPLGRDAPPLDSSASDVLLGHGGEGAGPFQMRRTTLRSALEKFASATLPPVPTSGPTSTASTTVPATRL